MAAEDDQAAPYIGTKTFSDLPLELVRKIVEPLGLRDRARAVQYNKRLREAVMTSKCTCLGNGMLIVSATKNVHEELDIQIDFGGEYRITKLTEESNLIFDRIRGFFEKELHFEELQMVEVPLGHTLFDKFYAFLDDCTYNRLMVADNNIVTNPVVYKLMGKAEHVVVKKSKFSMITAVKKDLHYVHAMAPYNRPRAPEGPLIFVEAADFMERVRAVESFTNVETNLETVEALAEVIKMVSRSKVGQKIVFYNKNVDVVQSYVQIYKAVRLCDEYAPGAGARSGLSAGCTEELKWKLPPCMELPMTLVLK